MKGRPVHLETTEVFAHRQKRPSAELRDPPLTAAQAAEYVGLSLAAFWRSVAAERMPCPVYPLPKAPRWFGSELRAALDATRAMPREQMESRRIAKLARGKKSAT